MNLVWFENVDILSPYFAYFFEINSVLVAVSNEELVDFTIKIIYSEKATKFLSYLCSASQKISQNFVAFSEYMNEADLLYARIL